MSTIIAAKSAAQPLVMGIALHPYIVGQPYRLRHLRAALAHLARARDRGDVWFTTPGAIAAHVEQLAPEDQREKKTIPAERTER